MSDARKIEHVAYLEISGVGAFLRGLAAGADGGNIVVAGQSYPLAAGSVSLSLKPLGRQVRVKLKVKPPRPAGHESDQGAQAPGTALSYKKLKKRMKADFKRLRADVAANVLPEPALVARFLEDATAMTGFPGKGDEQYPAFRQVVARLTRAFEAADLDAVRAGLDALDRLKRSCHERHA